MLNITIIDSQKIPEDLKFEPLKPQLVINTLNLLFLKDISYLKLIEFLMLFVHSLKYLSIIRLEATIDTQEIYRSVLRNFKTLTGLAVDFDHFPTNSMFYTELGVNRRLKNLALNSRILDNPEGLRGLARTFPAIEQLSISIAGIGSLMGADDFAFLFEKLKALNSFFLVIASSTELNRGFFRSITSLNIVNCPVPINWAGIAQSSPNLKTLIVSKVLNNNVLNFKSIVTNLRNLEHLELGDGFKIRQTQMKIIKSRAVNLKVFKLLKSGWKIKSDPSTILRMFDIRNLQIVLQSIAYENVSFYSNTFFFKCA